MASRAKSKWKYRQDGVHRELKAELAARAFSRIERAPHSTGEPKMSSVFLEFVAPYTAMAKSEEQYRTAIQIGLIAWNVAFLPRQARKEKLDSLIEQLAPANAADLRNLIEEMIERKERSFGDCRRWILGHRVEMTPGGARLSVVSAAE
jgi:hypothetical protein